MGNYKFEIGESFLYWNIVYTICDRYIFDNPIYNTVEIRYRIKHTTGHTIDVLESDLEECMKVDKDYTEPKMSIEESFQNILDAAYVMSNEYSDDILEEAVTIAETCMLIPKIDDAQKLKYQEALTDLIKIAEIVSDEGYVPDDINEKILIAKECILVPKPTL